jgi:lysozyme
MVNGLDVSVFQDQVDWKTVHGAGFSWAACRATFGLSTDTTFAANYAGIAAAGMLRSAYHFFVFADDPVAQANHFLSVVKPQPGDLPPMLDVEQTPNMSAGAAIQRLGQFLSTVEAHTHARCLFYIALGFWQGSLGSTDAFAGHPLWIAEYIDPRASSPPPPKATPPAVLPPPPVIVPPWKTWTLWQYSDQGRVPGIGPNVDLDVFNGDIDALRALRLT